MNVPEFSVAKAESLAIAAGVVVAGFVAVVVIRKLWAIKTAAVTAVTDSAPRGGTIVDTAASGVVSLLGQTYGLPTARAISEDRTMCVNSTGYLDASKNCSATDFFRWMRGDFNVSSAYPDESLRGSRAAVTTAR